MTYGILLRICIDAVSCDTGEITLEGFDTILSSGNLRGNECKSGKSHIVFP